MRRPRADREEKRVTRGSDTIRKRTDQEQLDLNGPNQRGLLGGRCRCKSAGDFRNADAIKPGGPKVAFRHFAWCRIRV